MIIMLQVPMSSSESGLSDEHDPMAVMSDDEIAPEPKVFTSDTESDPDMISGDEDDFQPFALPDFREDIPDADILIDDVFALPALVHEQLIIGHPDGEHIVAPIFDVVPLGDGEVDDVVVVDVPPPVVPVIDISSVSSLHSVTDSFASVTSSALRAAGLQLYATDDDNDAMSAAPSSHVRVPTPPHAPDHVPDPEPEPVPFGIPDIAPLIPEHVPAPLDLPLVDPLVPQPPLVDVASPHFVLDEHRTDLLIVFLKEIPTPRPREGT
ncbi:hypothetical protein Hanom_Chr02g00133541 [Helianthus anomalus]